jgi:hypothetical protein
MLMLQIILKFHIYIYTVSSSLQNRSTVPLAGRKVTTLQGSPSVLGWDAKSEAPYHRHLLKGPKHWAWRPKLWSHLIWQRLLFCVEKFSDWTLNNIKSIYDVYSYSCDQPPILVSLYRYWSLTVRRWGWSIYRMVGGRWWGPLRRSSWPPGLSALPTFCSYQESDRGTTYRNTRWDPRDHLQEHKVRSEGSPTGTQGEIRGATYRNTRWDPRGHLQEHKVRSEGPPTGTQGEVGSPTGMQCKIELF